MPAIESGTFLVVTNLISFPLMLHLISYHFPFSVLSGRDPHNFPEIKTLTAESLSPQQSLLFLILIFEICCSFDNWAFHHCPIPFSVWVNLLIKAFFAVAILSVLPKSNIVLHLGAVNLASLIPVIRCL